MPTVSPTVGQKRKIRQLATRSQCVFQTDSMSAYNGEMSTKIWICELCIAEMTDRACLNGVNEQLFFPLCPSKPHTDDLLSGHSHDLQTFIYRAQQEWPSSSLWMGQERSNHWDGREAGLCVAQLPLHFPPGLLFILRNLETASCLFLWWR